MRLDRARAFLPTVLKVLGQSRLALTNRRCLSKRAHVCACSYLALAPNVNPSPLVNRMSLFLFPSTGWL